MDITRGKELQERIGLDALTLLVQFGDGISTERHERSIRMVGKTWDIPGEETQAWLDAIAKEHSYAESGSPEHVRPEEELPVNLSGLETLNMIWDLFETAVQMDDLSDRQEMLDFAKWMEESQNLLDWIKLTQAEREAWKEGSASA